MQPWWLRAAFCGTMVLVAMIIAYGAGTQDDDESGVL